MNEQSAERNEELKRRVLDLGQAFTAVIDVAKDVAYQDVEGVCRRATAECKRAGAQVAQIESSLGQMISDKPIRSLLAAAGIGCLLGAVLRRR